MLLLSILLAVVDLAEVFEHDSAWDRPPSAYTKLSHRHDIEWKGAKIVDWRLIPEGSGVGRVELNLYNRGDDKSGTGMSEVELKELLERNIPGVDLSKAVRRKIKAGAFQYEYLNDKTKPAIEAGWGVSDGKVEYLRVSLVKSAKKKTGVQKPVSGKASKAKIVANVRKEANGDVWIGNIPMVDQGDKGYCAVATCERVLRYYGETVDEHQLAQMAGTTAKDGTSSAAMKETVKTIGSKFRLGYNDVFSATASRKDILKDLELYNKSAKALKRPELNERDFYVGNTFMVPLMREAMEPEVLLRMRAKDPRFKKFMSSVRARIDEGIPVFWGVTLGIFPEPDIPQANGGHMRLIIGYNAKTEELIFSDSWGERHAFKRMRADRAFAITSNAYTLRPL
jgi:hypothetical protein